MKAFEKLKSMSRKQKIDFAAASVLTAAFMVALPTYAWFASNKNLETITKIKEPGEIMIRAGKSLDPDEADSIVNFEMKDIDIEKIAAGTPQCFVFSVSPGDYTLGYNIQLAHTTNIPFVYKIYHATEVCRVDGAGSSGVSSGVQPDVSVDDLIPYHTIGDSSTIVYYDKVDSDTSDSLLYTPIAMNKLNESSDLSKGRIAKQDDSGDAYSNLLRMVIMISQHTERCSAMLLMLRGSRITMVMISV